MNLKYLHTNLVADDWKSLSKFYEEAFGCKLVPPERDYTGEAIEKGTGIPGVHLTGIHLRLPGYGENGPTLEIFSYEPKAERVETRVNRAGYGHIAFQIDNVEEVRNKIIKAGGKEVGEIVEVVTSFGGKIKWCYVTDPEGNVIELQSKS